MSAIPLRSRPLPPRLQALLLSPVALVAAAVLVVAAAVVTLAPSQAARPAAPPRVAKAPVAPHSAAIEARYGIRLLQLGLTADGGMLDLRYAVIDPDRSVQLTHGNPVRIKLQSERTGHVLDSEEMAPHGHNERAGATVFMLFRNDSNLFARGSYATIIVGQLRLSHVPVL
jgi:hypothetical protein